MIIQKKVPASPPGKMVKGINQNATYIIETLNEIKRENIIQIVAELFTGSIVSYVVFYEDKDILVCPDCRHSLSTTFSFCPNCGRKLK